MLRTWTAFLVALTFCAFKAYGLGNEGASLGSATSNIGLSDILPFFQNQTIIQKGIAPTIQERNLNSQVTNVDIINDCRYDLSIHAIFMKNGLMEVMPSWVRLNKQKSLTVEHIMGSKLWFYGKALSYFGKDIKADNSMFCVSDGNCYQEIDLSNFSSGSVHYWICSQKISRAHEDEVQLQSENAKEDPPSTPATLTPTIAPQTNSTSSPSLSPTRLRVPPKPPTSNTAQIFAVSAANHPPTPTKYPTSLPTNAPSYPDIFTGPPTTHPTSSSPSSEITTSMATSDTDFREEWIEAHNSRRRHFFDLFGMDSVDLQWSDSIAQSAQNYANKLAKVDGKCLIAHDYDGDRYGGENLAMNHGSGRWAKARTPEEILQVWYDDEIDLDRMELVGQKYHASQVLWRSTRYFGCAQAEKRMDDIGHDCFIQVCRYIGVGNCFIHEHSTHPSVISSLPENCLEQNPGWVCSVLSDSASKFCAPDEQCPNEGCFHDEERKV